MCVLLEATVEMFRKVNLEWGLNLTKRETETLARLPPHTGCEGDKSHLDAKVNLEAEDSEVTARTMKSAGDAKSITVDIASSSWGAVTPASFGASAPLTAQAEYSYASK